MWIHLPNGRTELVLNPDHIKRLLSEGGHEVPDPREPVKAEEPVSGAETTEETGGEQSNEDTTPPPTTTKTTKRGK